jgi:hypothetical protein
MANKLPPDFNPEAYAAAYPDVALSGLGAHEHFRRFGRLLGRSPSGKPREGKAKAAPPPILAVERAVEPDLPAATGVVATPTTVPPPPRPPASEAIVARPDDFTTADVMPSPAPVKLSRGGTEAFTFDDFDLKDPSAGGAEPLRAYARMVGIADPVGDEAGEALRACDERFQIGDCRIENAWFADPMTLRLMVAAEPDAGASLAGSAMRAFQALPGAPAELRAAGAGITFPERGPCFFDIALSHPLMPVLIELADQDGASRALTLMPFPSLLPGGLHGAEAKALQNAANPILSFWSLSEQFRAQLIDDKGRVARSVVEVMAEADTIDGSMLSEDVCEWLAVIFGLKVNQAAPKTSGLRLVLPPDAIPTIAVLVARGLDDCVGCAGPFVVARTVDRGALASVSLPRQCDPGPVVPRLERRGRGRRKAGARPSPVHLAIVYRRPLPLRLHSADSPSHPSLPPLTILIDATDPDRTEALARQLKDQLGSTDVDLHVRWDGGAKVCATLDRMFGAGQWRDWDTRASLRQLAREARHDVLLTIDDRVRLEGDTLTRLLAMLDGDADIASASCLLVNETIVKKQVVLQPGSGGLFPSGVSFLRGPAMAFAEPDVSTVLRDMTFPVVANSLALTVWRRSSLAGLPDPAAPIPRGADDLATGLDLTRSGCRNLYTTLFSAAIVGNRGRRDAIDPVGTTVIAPGQWQDLLDRVTIVRELY